MPDEVTSPAPAVETGSSSPEGGTPADTSEVVESHETPTTAQEEASTSPDTPASWSHTDWDETFDTLPDNVRSVVEQRATEKEKNLEAGYTPKLQALSEDRKTFDTEREAWAAKEADYALLKALMDGDEDPRVATLTQDRDEWKTKAETGEATWKAKYEESESAYKALQDKQDRTAVEQFKAKHPDLVKDTKSDQYKRWGDYVDQGWSMDNAAELVTLTPEAAAKAHAYAVEGVPQGKALHFAKLETSAPSAPRTPRPAAGITSGAGGGSRTAGRPINNLKDMSREDAYKSVASRLVK